MGGALRVASRSPAWGWRVCCGRSWPGFPLDGGRLLRAALWRWKGTLARATYLASRVGTGVAFALVGLGVLQMLAGGLVGGFWLILIGLFLRGAADASYAQTALREALQHLRVRDVMTRDVVTVTPEATLEELVEKFWAHHFTGFPVARDGRVYGIAAVHDLHAVPREWWREARAGEVMRPLGEGFVVARGDSVVQALEKAAGNGLGRLAVVESGRLAGYLSLKDITHVLVLRGLAPLRTPEVEVPGAVRELGRAA